MGRGANAEGSGARTRYCVVPEDLAEKLIGPLREHFAESPRIEVVQEQRGADRRSGVERRQADAQEQVPACGDRRRIKNPYGRRVAERRAPVVAIEPPEELPRRARRHAERLLFCERLAPSLEQREDVDAARLVIAFQTGQEGAFSELYRRYFDRVFGYLRLFLEDHHESEDAVQEVFVSALGALGRYELRGQPFRSWLFAIARNQALDLLQAQGRIDVTDPTELTRHQEATDLRESPALGALKWVSDSDMLILLRRLPPLQREVMAMRFLLDMKSTDIARVLDRSPDSIRRTQLRATRYLRERLTALGHAPEGRHRGRSSDRNRDRMKINRRQWVVLRQRRFILMR